jgi:hypothetical protein
MCWLTTAAISAQRSPVRSAASNHSKCLATTDGGAFDPA